MKSNKETKGNSYEFVNSRHSSEGGNPYEHNFSKRMDSRLKTSGMTAIKRTSRESIKRGAIIMLLLLSFICAPLIVYATAYMPFFHSQDRVVTAMKSGQDVYLFHSGTDYVSKTIQVGDILTVYRIAPTCEVKEVGKIKAALYIGETYLKGKVVEGEIKPDDIAKKGNVSCLIISAEVCKE